MKILFATDGSDHSRKAAQFLKYFAFTHDDEIVVLHSIGWVPFKEDCTSYQASLTKIKHEVGPKIIDAAVEILEPLGARVAGTLCTGSPHKMIAQCAAAADVDLVVMGARGLKGVASVMIGSVTRALAITSAKPVLVVKPMPWETGERLKILVATDGSEHARRVIKLLKVLPFKNTPEYMIVSVTKPLRYEVPPGALTYELEKELDAAVMAQVEKAKLVIAEAQKDLAAPLGVIRIGDPIGEILDRADVHKADLIAVGSRGVRGVEGMIGSVSRGILGRANASVLIGK